MLKVTTADAATKVLSNKTEISHSESVQLCTKYNIFSVCQHVCQMSRFNSSAHNFGFSIRTICITKQCFGLRDGRLKRDELHSFTFISRTVSIFFLAKHRSSLKFTKRITRKNIRSTLAHVLMPKRTRTPTTIKIKQKSTHSIHSVLYVFVI